MTTWADVAAGDVVEVRGQQWRITEQSKSGMGMVTMINLQTGAVSTGSPPPAGTVMRVERQGAEVEAATALAGAGVGVTRLATQTGGAPWRVPKTLVGLPDFRSHSLLMHGVYTGDVKSRARMEQWHRQSHEDALAGVPDDGWQAHEHTDDPWRD